MNIGNCCGLCRLDNESKKELNRMQMLGRWGGALLTIAGIALLILGLVGCGKAHAGMAVAGFLFGTLFTYVGVNSYSVGKNIQEVIDKPAKYIVGDGVGLDILRTQIGKRTFMPDEVRNHIADNMVAPKVSLFA